MIMKDTIGLCCDKPQVIATSSSLIIFNLQRNLFLFKTVSVIWFVVKHYAGTNQMF